MLDDDGFPGDKSVDDWSNSYTSYMHYVRF
jgi:hypothetical protein